MTGLCECGCGQVAPRAAKTSRIRGQIKGEPLRFVHGHNGRRTPAERFWEKVDRRSGTDCWIWLGAKSAAGYGQLRVGGIVVYAHRLAYEWTHGPTPEGRELDHLCRNRACVNPAHLEPVSHTENVRRGARTRLTEADVSAIRQSALSHPELARLFGVTDSWISRLKGGHNWSDNAEEAHA